MEFWCGKLPRCFIFLICITVSFALQLSDCIEFKVIPPEQYDRNTSSADDITKRPLGYMFATAKYPGVQSGGNLKNPCAYLKNLTSRAVEVMLQPLVSGKSVCVRDNETPTPQKDCATQGALNSGCWNPSADMMIYEFYCDPGAGCDTDVQFWYRLTPSPIGADVDDWCNGRDSEFPENLVTAPPPVEVKTTVKSAASSVLFWNICLSLLLVWCMYISLL